MLVAIDIGVALSFCLGLGLVITGFVGLKKGRIWYTSPGDSGLFVTETGQKSLFPRSRSRFVRALMTYRTIERTEKPGSFWAVTICLYWAFGLFFLACSALFVMQKPRVRRTPLMRLPVINLCVPEQINELRISALDFRFPEYRSSHCSSDYERESPKFIPEF